MLLVLMLVACVGCTMVPQDDGTFTLGMSDKVANEVSGITTGLAEALGGLSAFFPALVPVAAAAGVGAVTWKKMKKKVVATQAPLEMIVGALDEVKKVNPTVWADVKKQIEMKHPTIDMKLVIEEMQRKS
jgi:hypothetical protein